MARGRCAGCGETSGSSTKIQRHIVQCPKYAELYRDHPERALGPVAEYARWLDHEGSADAKESAREERLTKTFADQEIRREQSVARWVKPKDPLADDDDD